MENTKGISIMGTRDSHNYLCIFPLKLIMSGLCYWPLILVF